MLEVTKEVVGVGMEVLEIGEDVGTYDDDDVEEVKPTG